jgi:hypothetical protein
LFNGKNIPVFCKYLYLFFGDNHVKLGEKSPKRSGFGNNFQRLMAYARQAGNCIQIRDGQTITDKSGLGQNKKVFLIMFRRRRAVDY